MYRFEQEKGRWVARKLYLPSILHKSVRSLHLYYISVSPGSFNTWSFLAMIMAGINGVSLVAGNINNRSNNNDNNNDNNNQNNDNSVQLNEADTEGDIDAVNPPIVLPPVVGRRRRRRRRGRGAEAAPSSSSPPPLSTVAVSASLAWLRAASASSLDPACLSRTVCELSGELRSFPPALGLAAGLGIAQSSGTADAENLLRAARTGRAGARAPLSGCTVYHHVSALKVRKEGEHVHLRDVARLPLHYTGRGGCYTY